MDFEVKQHGRGRPEMKVSTSTKGTVTEDDVVRWELKAARRGLMNLRTLLYGAPMTALLKAQIEESDRRIKEYIAASKGEVSECRTTVAVNGLKADAFFAHMVSESQKMSNGTPAEKSELMIKSGFVIHPEHYALPPYPGIIETIGGLPTRMRTLPDKEPPPYVKAAYDDAYPFKFPGKAELDDGTLVAWVAHQFRNTNEGLEAVFRVWWPAACPPNYVEDHAEHFAIEFCNAFELAAAGIAQPN